MPFRTVTLTCTGCRAELEPVELDGIPAEVCTGCRATWLSTDAFWALFREHQPNALVEELLIHNDGSPRQRCPRCKKMMSQAWLDFLELETCEGCRGLWLERGELARALAYEVGHEVLEVVRIAERAREKRKNRDG